MQSNNEVPANPVAEILTRQFTDYCEYAARVGFGGGNDTNFLTIGPAENCPPDQPKIWGIAFVTKDPLKLNMFLHACNLLIAIIVFAAEMGRRAHQATLSKTNQGDTDHGS